jgi:hypothetical protein
MSQTRTVALGAVAWLVVVVVGATLVWAVVSRAGEGVSSSAQPPLVDTSSEGRGSATRTPSSSSDTTTASDPAASTSSPTATRRTWQGAAGVVVSTCTGEVIELTGAQPSSGWKIEVDDAGPDQVRVELETSDERVRTRVEAACVDGVPTYEVDTREKG